MPICNTCKEEFFVFDSWSGPITCEYICPPCQAKKQADNQYTPKFCVHCGRQSFHWENYITHEDKDYCSAKCIRESRKEERETVTCYWCKKPIFKRSSKKFGSTYFCSDACVYLWRLKVGSERQQRRRRTGDPFADMFEEAFGGAYQSFYEQFHSKSSSATQVTVSIPKDIYNFLLMHCHPDKHNNSEISNKVTRWLLEHKP